jgi:hypothetical protein
MTYLMIIAFILDLILMIKAIYLEDWPQAIFLLLLIFMYVVL